MPRSLTQWCAATQFSNLSQYIEFTAYSVTNQSLYRSYINLLVLAFILYFCNSYMYNSDHSTQYYWADKQIVSRPAWEKNVWKSFSADNKSG